MIDNNSTNSYQLYSKKVNCTFTGNVCLYTMLNWCFFVEGFCIIIVIRLSGEKCKWKLCNKSYINILISDWILLLAQTRVRTQSVEWNTQKFIETKLLPNIETNTKKNPRGLKNTYLYKKNFFLIHIADKNQDVIQSKGIHKRRSQTNTQSL